jgi:hypothetical protein
LVTIDLFLPKIFNKFPKFLIRGMRFFTILFFKKDIIFVPSYTHKLKSYKDNTVTFSADNITRKILKITSSGGDGSFNIHLPYHKEKKGFLYTIKFPYRSKSGRFFVKIKQSITKKFVTSTDVKLSIHRSGFVQFSKDSKIISGIDETNKIKGLGIKISPLERPITSGPTVSVIVWGLDSFDILTREKDKINYIKFEDSDFIYEDCVNSTFNSYVFEIFVFSNKYLKYVYKKNNQWLLSKSFNNYLPEPGKIITSKVVLIKNCPSFIAIFGKKLRIGEEMGTSGYEINGPAQALNQKIDGLPVWEHIKACYPIPGYVDTPVRSIDRERK